MVTNTLIHTTNITTTSPTPHNTTQHSWLFFVSILVYTTVFVVGIVGNILVLAVFGSRWRKLKTCEFHLVNLAVADLVASVVVPADKLYYLVGGHYGIIGAGWLRCYLQFLTPSYFQFL